MVGNSILDIWLDWDWLGLLSIIHALGSRLEQTKATEV